MLKQDNDLNEHICVIESSPDAPFSLRIHAENGVAEIDILRMGDAEDGLTDAELRDIDRLEGWKTHQCANERRAIMEAIAHVLRLTPERNALHHALLRYTNKAT